MINCAANFLSLIPTFLFVKLTKQHLLLMMHFGRL